MRITSDFGIVVDGSIVILEGILAHIYGRRLMGRTLSKEEMDAEVEKGAGNVVRSATFAVLIILIVFFPILTLTGVEGKYFTPMAKTLVFCIIGALLLSLTYVPMMASLLLKRTVSVKPTLADRFFEKLNRVYRRTLDFCLSHVWGTLVSAFTLLILSFFLFTRLGAEFIPTLDEGDFAMQMTLPAGSSLSRSIEVSLEAEKKLKQDFPEIKHVVAKIGTAEVPTDPMAVEDADVMIVMKPFSEWTSASSRAEMVEKMKKSLETVEGTEFNFSQPIQLRFNELMTGAKADIAIKLYGEDMTELYAKAKEAAKFTTAYDEYALRAFKVNSVAYLLKPISRTDLREAMYKLELLGGQVKEEKQPDLSAIIRSLKKEENYKTHFLVPVKGDKLLPVSVEAILYFYISNGLVKAVDSEGKEFVFSQSLDELAEQLNPHDFFRANRQFIVSRKAVSDISLRFNGRLAINLKVPVPEKIIISKAKASELKDWF